MAALSSLLFAGVTLLVAQYNWSSFIQMVMIPVVYYLPHRQNKPVALLTGVGLAVSAFVVSLTAGDRLGIGSDVLGGLLAVISVSLAADASIHDMASLRRDRSVPGKPKEMLLNTFEVRPEYVLF